MNQSGYQDLLNTSQESSDQSIIYNLILPNLDPNSVPYIDIDNTVQDRILSDGQLLVGVTSGPPLAASITGTTNQVIVSNGPGSIGLSLPQDIATNSDPTFNDLTVNHINGKVANDLVTGSSTSVLDRLASYADTSGEVIKDSLINSADVFLRTGTVAATGNFNMNNKELQDVAAIRPHDSNLNIGNSTTMPLGTLGTINIGDFSTSTGNTSVNIGLQNIARGNSVAIGYQNQTGIGATVIGYRSSCGSRADTIVIGRDNLSIGANGADIIGVNQTNSTSNSLLLGNGSYANIRASGGVCDLGTSLVPFQSLYSNASISGTVNSRLTNDIISNTSTGTLNNIVTFVSDKVVKDSTIPISAISGYPYLPLAGGTMASAAIINSNSGSITNLTNLNGTALTNYIITPSTIDLNMNTHALSNVTTINTKTANDLVTSAANGAINMVATYAGTSKAIQSSGTVISDLATTAALTAGLALKVAKAGDTMSGDLLMGTNNIKNVGILGGATNIRNADNVLSCTVNPTYGNLPMWSLTNKVFDDSGISSFNVVTGPASAVNNNLCSYNLTSGKIIKDTGILSTDVVTGPASVPAINNIAVYSSTTGKAITSATTGIGTIGALTLANTTASSSPTTGTLILSGSGAGLGVNGKVFTNDNVVIGPTQTITLENRLTLRGTASSSTAGPAIASYVTGSQYPVWQMLPYAVDNQWQAYDAYFDGAWRSSSTNYNFGFNKLSNGMYFNYNSGVAAGSGISWNTAGSINTTGQLTWNKKITVSTSPGGTVGLDLATADSYANLRVIQSIGGPDNHLYLNYNSGTTSYCYLYSNNAVTMKVEGANVGIGMSPVTGGGNTNNLQIANGAGPTTNPTGGGALYVNAGRLFFKGSAGTVTQLAVA